MKQVIIRTGWVTLTALVILAGLMVPLTLASPNATFTVTKTADTYDGTCNADCSLREAIGAADLAPGSTVIVPAGTYVLTRTGYNEDNNATGDLDITANMIITSATGVRPTVQAAGGLLDRVLQAMTNTNVTINNLMFYNGTSNIGGGIYALGDLTLNNVYVVSNTASWGGGLFVDGHALTMTGGVVWVNAASGVGGGIGSQDGTVLISNSLIMSNAVTGLTPGSGYGGGIAALNSATNTIASALTVVNSTIVSNTAPNTTAAGAGIYGGGHITLINDNLYANQSGGGGGGLYSANPAATVNITGSSFMTNTAMGSGGGGFFNYSTLIMTNTLIQSNTASGGGGFINNNGVMTVTGGQILSNTSTDSSVSGGGIRSFNYLKLNGVTIRYNKTVGSGGGIIASDQLSVTGGLIANNQADSQGGGVSTQGGTATFDHVAILTNTALYGGGVSNGGTTSLINASAVNNNQAFQGGGVLNLGTLNITNGSVISNSTTPSCLGCSNGGGIFNANILQLNNTVISTNKTDNGSGAGVYNASTGNFTASNSAIVSNTTGVGNGGGISNTGTLSLTNVTFSANTAQGDGGALANTKSAQLSFVTIANNIADNDANGSGVGGGLANTGALTVTGSLIGNNQVKTGLSADCYGPLYSGDYILLETTAQCTVTGATAHSYLSVDPALDLLTSLGGTYVHPLLANSVAINHGGSPLCPTTDQRGVARPIGSACDSGAFESAFLDPQTITFNAIPDHLLGDAPFVVTATASSGLSVTFTSLTASVCTIHGDGLVTLLDLGACTLRASQVGNASYQPAPDVDRSFGVKQAQTISFDPLPDRLVNDPPFAITATASSGLIVSFNTSGVCNFNGTQVTLTGLAGTCTITATQAGDPVYAPAPDVARTFTVKQSQTITFNALPDRLISDPPFIITATATSGLNVRFYAGGVCTASGTDGTQINLTGIAGTCLITATQIGNAVYAPAPEVTQTFAVKQPQTISFDPLPDRLVSDPPFIITATATSGLSITFKAQGACDVAGNQVTLAGSVGTCLITAYQDGNATYAPAAAVDQSFTIQQGQTISFAPLPDRRIDATPFNVSATASSTLVVTFTASGACTSTGVNGTQINLTAVGDCTVTAHQVGNDEYAPAPDVARTFKVTPFKVYLPIVIR